MSMQSKEVKGVVVFHSGDGHIKPAADAVAEGPQASLLQIDADGGLPDQAWADTDESAATSATGQHNAP